MPKLGRKKPRVTKADIKKALRELGLKGGDIVGVHSSLSSFGYVEGGADAVIDAILETVGPEGSVVFPTYSNNRENLERTPEEIEMGVTWKYRVLPYDPEKDPCWTVQSLMLAAQGITLLPPGTYRLPASPGGPF